MEHVHGLILAGGRGTRFWPKSRRHSAKQVLRLFGDRSLIQQTVDRLRPILPPERIWILTNGHLREEIVRQLPEVPKRQILAEPAQRNTAPAIGLAAQILHGLDPESIMGVFPADHIIGKPLLIFWSYDAPTADLVGYSSDHFIDLAKNFFFKTRWDRELKLVRGYPIQ